MEATIMKKEIGYKQEGDYQIPDLEMPQQQDIGRFGRERLAYLQEQKHALYTSMIIKGTLNEHLLEVNQTAEERIDELAAQMLQSSPAPDKAADQMGWVAHMNMLREQATEIVLKEIVRN
ncbi:MAG: TnpV protein [Cloacibacillus porcorum]|nr:TnpV protein [Cloacibacillus porcorum]